MNYYEHHIGDFRSGTVNMTRLERWIYRDLLEVYYDTERPLKADVDMLCKDIGARSDEEKAVVREILAYKFTLTERGYEHERCEATIVNYQSKADTARENGKKGGRPKKGDGNPEKPSGLFPVSDGNQEETGLKANQKPRTKNQEPNGGGASDVSGCASDGAHATSHLLNAQTGEENPRPVQIRLLLRQQGMPVTSNSAEVIEMNRAGVTDREILEALDVFAVKKPGDKPNAGYLLKMIVTARESAAKVVADAGSPPDARASPPCPNTPWRRSMSAAKELGAKLGLKQKAGEDDWKYRVRVAKKAGDREWQDEILADLARTSPSVYAEVHQHFFGHPPVDVEV